MTGRGSVSKPLSSGLRRRATRQAWASCVAERLLATLSPQIVDGTLDCCCSRRSQVGAHLGR